MPRCRETGTPGQLFLIRLLPGRAAACGCGRQYTPGSPARRTQRRQESKRPALLKKSLPEKLLLEQLLKLPVPSLHLIRGNILGGRKFKFGRQRIPDPHQNTNEVGAGYQQIQEFPRYITREFRAKSRKGKINAGQDPKTQCDPECGATPGQAQEAGKEQ